MLQRSDRDLIRWCGEQGTGVLATVLWRTGCSPSDLGGTAFAPGDFRGHEGGEAWEAMFRPDPARSQPRARRRARPVADRLGCTLAQLVLAWTAAQPGGTAAIAGSRNPRHVRSNAAAR